MEVAQLVSVLDLGSRGRRFESCLPYLLFIDNPKKSAEEASKFKKDGIIVKINNSHI